MTSQSFRFQLDTQSGVPYYRQVIEQVKFAIARGQLAAGDQLPTVRQLAVDLSVNPNTVVRAYRQLETEQILRTQQGSGTFVSSKRPPVDQLERRRMLDQIITDLMARGTSYGFSLDDILDGLAQRKEASP